MRHTPCGCRSAHLVEVRSNPRLPPHSSMRRAPAMLHSASSLPPRERHTRLTIVRRGCKRKRLAGIHGEAMYTAPDCAARAVLQATDCQCKSLSFGRAVHHVQRLRRCFPAAPCRKKLCTCAKSRGPFSFAKENGPLLFTAALWLHLFLP